MQTKVSYKAEGNCLLQHCNIVGVSEAWCLGTLGWTERLVVRSMCGSQLVKELRMLMLGLNETNSRSFCWNGWFSSEHGRVLRMASEFGVRGREEGWLKRTWWSRLTKRSRSMACVWRYSLLTKMDC